MKNIIALFVIFCVCLAFANVCNTPNNSLIIETICDLKECQGYIKKSIIDSCLHSNKAISNSNNIKIDIKEANGIDIVLKISLILGSISVVVGSIMFIFRKLVEKEIKNELKKEFLDLDKKLVEKFTTQKDDFEKLFDKKLEEKFDTQIGILKVQFDEQNVKIENEFEKLGKNLKNKLEEPK